MRRLRLWPSLACLTVAALGACGARTDPVAPTIAGPVAGDSAGGPEAAAQAADGTAPLRVPLGTGVEQVALLTASLDDDANREQVIAFRATGTPRSPISVGVIDYQDDGANWQMIWEAATQATNPDTLQLSVVELVDDPVPEIVVQGTAGDDRQTLDAYRRATAADGSGAAYRAIARITAHGTIELGDTSGEGAGAETTAAVAIIAHVQAPESASGLDLLRLTYGWDPERDQYVLHRTEPTATPAEPDESPSELFASAGVEPFEAFLAGPWYRDIPSRTIAGGTRREVLIFASDERLISVYDGEVLEQYEWVVSHRPLILRLDVWARNLTIEVIGKTFSIEAESAATIRVEVRGTDRNDVRRGTYQRLTPAQQEKLLAGKAEAPIVVLSGLYRSADGLSIDFIGDRFQWSDDRTAFEGGFALRGRVLSMKIVGSRGEHQGYRSYLVDYTEEASSQRIERSLRLTPAGEGLPGAAAEPVLHLTQVERTTE